MNRVIKYTMLCSLVLGHIDMSLAADDEKINRLSSMAKKPSVVLPNDTPMLKFDFDEIKATLKKNGEITVKGWVSHSRIRCATYSVGLRFGQGDYACTNVKWLTEERYLTFRKQCNSATVEHDGFEVGKPEELVFDKVTCAQRLIRCTGTCD